MPKRQRLAEIGIQVRHNRRGQQDGDLLEVIPEMERRRHWAEVLTNRKVATGKRFSDGSPERVHQERQSDGSIAETDVLVDYLSSQHRFKFRILHSNSDTGVEITELATGQTQVVPSNGKTYTHQWTGKPAAYNAREYLARRLSAKKKPMFKDSEGKWFYFGGGGRRPTHNDMDTVWTAVENKLQVGEENYLFYPHGSTLRNKLILMTGDIHGPVAGRLRGNLLGRMKLYRVAWVDLDELSYQTKRDILKPRVKVDVRDKMAPLVLDEVAQIRGDTAPLLEPEPFARRS